MSFFGPPSGNSGFQPPGGGFLPRFGPDNGFRGAITAHDDPQFPASAAAVNAAFLNYGVWVSAWNFNETSGNANDFIGGVTLSPVNAPPSVVTSFGYFDNAREFTPQNTNVGLDAASAVPLDMAGTTTDFAVAAAFRCYAVKATASYRGIAGKQVAAFTHGYELGLNGAGPGPSMIWGVRDSTHGGATTVTLAGAWDDGNWHYALGVCDRTNGLIQLFTDLGQTATNTPNVAGDYTSTAKFCVGRFDNQVCSPCDVTFCAVATGDIPNLRVNGPRALRAFQDYIGAS